MTTRRGWVSSPNERGTMDIIWSCVSTLFICLWSMLHLNVPSKKDSFWTIVWRKARWLLLGILAPEVPMLFACGQWASAKRSVNDMRKLGFSDAEWSLEHAWYADSGGFELQPLEGEPLPITARQVWYLLENGFISLPSISKKEIWDKSNADKVTKFLAYFQTAWLVTQTVGRAIQHLAITPLELASIALALTSLTTLGFWMHKPLDVGTATTLHTDRSIRDILEHAGEIFLADFTNTPLDFIEPRIYVSRKCGSALLNWILHRGLQTRPIERIPDDRDPQLYNIYQRITLGIATASFASIHLAGWNFGFDTTWEMWLWRSNCLIMWGLLATFGTTEVIICCRDNFQSMGMDTLGGYKLRWPACLWFVIPGGLYVMARACLIFEVLFSMRSLPQEAFVEVQWSAMLPHI
ncbi:uncharacterized protein BDZ99DRAFT_510297 [Mytilinidion resinicola]|uniref:Uncharacterized protein n=1 Tax=Mytilinidion resinicola TaxID=574789 RepID=A0A6A6YHE7_9PEZI|nr:uncharacterized protein BDZ99DRAFT_510297 [Mytilinidion resinicola]KAF2807424.1 hypothetical protein BDZ99DRAFT_510297 [Mytilinidion resinicola]